MAKAILNAAYGGARAGVGGVGKLHDVVFTSRTLTPSERKLRTFGLMVLMFLLLNGSAYHVVGGLWWVLVNGILPLAKWPEGTAWWTSVSDMVTPLHRLLAALAFMAVWGVLSIKLWRSVAFVIAAALFVAVIGMLTNFPWDSLPRVASFDNIPFAIVGLLWLLAVGWLFLFLARTWKLAFKNLHGDFALLLGKTFLWVMAEVVLLLLYIWTVQPLMTMDFLVQVLMWGWQVPLGYFVGKGLNWLIENRQIAGQYGTREQGNIGVFPDANGDGVPDGYVPEDHR